MNDPCSISSVLTAFFVALPAIIAALSTLRNHGKIIEVREEQKEVKKALQKNGLTVSERDRQSENEQLKQ